MGGFLHQHYAQSSHIIILDHEKEELFEKVSCFIQDLERMIEKE